MFPCSECDSIFMLTGCLCTQSEIWHYCSLPGETCVCIWMLWNVCCHYDSQIFSWRLKQWSKYFAIWFKLDVLVFWQLSAVHLSVPLFHVKHLFPLQRQMCECLTPSQFPNQIVTCTTWQETSVVVDDFDEFKRIIIEVVFFRIGTHLLVEDS